MTTRFSRGAIACALMATTAITAPAFAADPLYRNFDDNGVDLVQGDLDLSFADGSIGSGLAELSLIRKDAGNSFSQWDRITFYQTVSGGVTTTTIGLPDGSFEKFANGTNVKANGGTLSGYLYTAADGTKINFVNPSNDPTEYGNNFCGSGGGWPCDMVPESIVYPDGHKITFTFTARGPSPLVTGRRQYYWRLESVSNSFGYSIQFAYQSFMGTYPPPAGAFIRTSAKFKRDNIVQSTVSYAYPAGGGVDVTDAAGKIWHVTDTSITRPDETTPFFQANSKTAVTSVTKNGVTTSYSRSVVGNTATMTVTDPLTKQRVIISDLTIGRPTSFKDENNKTTSFTYDTNGRLKTVTEPELNYTEYFYDARGNIKDTVLHDKAHSATTIATHASFDTTCANVVTCNKPNTTTDANGNVTSYTWDSGHGGMKTLRPPKSSTNAVQPEIVYNYSPLTTASGDSVMMLSGTSQCQAGDAGTCTNTADEARTATGYDAYGNVTSTSQSDGAGTVSASAAMSYDARGNMLTLNGPRTDIDDTTTYKYDAADRLTGIISPDPDSSGPQPYRGLHVLYRSDGQISEQDLGNPASTSDADLNGMTAIQKTDVLFDSLGRPYASRLFGGTSRQAQTQVSYDALGRVQCTAVRMDRNQFTADLGVSACTQGANSGDKDRITKFVYDDGGRVVQKRVQVGGGGSSDPGVAEQTFGYRDNGNVEYLIDANGQKSKVAYDGFDRTQCLIYPSASRPTAYDDSTQAQALATSGAVSGDCVTTGDYERYSYDDAGDVLTQRLRNGSSIAFSYDHRNRMTLKDLPGPEYDVSYRYDNLNRLTSNFQKDSGGVTIQNLTLGWDALSHNLSQGGPHGTTTFVYDPAGEKTGITYSTSGGGSALTINYGYLATGELISVKQGTTTLASYGYDSLGNRTSSSFGNGTSQAYSYDIVSRLASLTNVLGGTNNLTVDNIAYNPASQITSLRRTGDAYAFGGYATGSTTTTSNGLNQQTTVNGSSFSWDSNGNLASDATSGKGYSYSSENLLTSSTGGTAATLIYDPAMRLYQVAGSATTRFAYDDADAIAEYDGSSQLQRRFVFDPTTGQPVVQYEGTGTTAPRYLGADERGSVVSATDGSGGLLKIYKYDEYGIPDATNASVPERFQYTGQKWIPELGAYDFKARVYIPQLGTFAQTDPIGYAGDGPNLYAYVLNDPINFVDPSGNCHEGFVLVRSHAPASSGPDGGIVITAGVCVPVSSVLRTVAPLIPHGGGGQTNPTVCPVAVDAKITGVGPHQADTSHPTSISGTPGNQIKSGSVAIDPSDFGVPNNDASRQALGQVILVPIWSQAKRPSNGAPAVPPGLPSVGPYKPVDVIGPATARNKPGFQVDLYRYRDQDQAFASTRTVPVITVIPKNNAGVSCPTGN